VFYLGALASLILEHYPHYSSVALHPLRIILSKGIPLEDITCPFVNLITSSLWFSLQTQSSSIGT